MHPESLEIEKYRFARKLVAYQLADIDSDMSFLEMFDVLNGQLTRKGDVPIAF